MTARLGLLISLILVTVAPAAQAKPWWLRDSGTNESDFLPPDVAFRMGGSLVDAGTIRLRWVIADGYYLYKRKIEVRAESPDLSVGAPQLPGGEMKTDPFLGRQEIYTQQLEARVPYSRDDFGAHPIQIKITYQGCAEAGLCYPPIVKVLFLTLGAARAVAPKANASPREWQLIAMLGGILAFLGAGLALRRGRNLPDPSR